MPHKKKCFTKTANDGHKYQGCAKMDTKKKAKPKPKKKAETHKMKNGDIHTGSSHTKDSKLVKKAERPKIKMTHVYGGDKKLTENSKKLKVKKRERVTLKGKDGVKRKFVIKKKKGGY